MALELLAFWGVTAAWTCVFRPIVEELAGDVAKDWAKDFASRALKSVLGGKDAWTRAAGKAAKEFVEQFQEELIGAGETVETCQNYANDLKRFMADPPAREGLGAAVLAPEVPVDFALLQRRWDEVTGCRLPADFSWTKLCRRFQSKVRGVLQASDELRAILDSANADATRKGVERLAGIAPDFDLTRYRESLIKRYGHLRLELMDAGTTVPIQLAKVFVEQNVRDCQQFNPRHHELPKEHQRLLARKSERDESLDDERLHELRETYIQQPSRPVLEVVTDPANRCLVILGDPGSGKSVLLEYLALLWANRPVVELTANPIPLLIELKTYVQRENLGGGKVRSFLEFLDHGVGCCGELDQHHLHAALQRGSAFFLIDGIDEVFDLATRQAVVHDIAELTIRYPQARFIVTSRVVGYQHETLRNADFRHYMLQDLEPEQVGVFAERWHCLAYFDPAERARKQASLMDAIQRSRSVAELAANPLLLTLMALLNRQQELPRDRTELYDQASRLLLQNWDASRALEDDPLLAGKSFDYRDKQAMLRAIAHRMQTGPKGLSGNAISVADLEDTLVGWLKTQGYGEPRPLADRLVQQLRGRNFILCFLGDDFYGFVHRTFLEFFCAWSLVWRFKEQQEWTIGQLQEHTFGAHWQDEKWHEVLRLVAARLEPRFAARLIGSLLEKKDSTHRQLHIFLAAECLADVRNRSELAALDHRVRREIQRCCHFDLPFYYDDWDWEIAQIPREVRQRAGSILAFVWPDTNSRIFLVQCARSDAANDVRMTAVRELARGWKDDPDTLPILKDRARSDDHYAVRMTAVQELARGWKDDPDTLPWLKDRARSDAANDVRMTAVRELARGWKDDPDTLPILKDRAHSDAANAVRRTAVQELARGWKDDPDTLPWLKDRARSDAANDVRMTAVRELARGWKDDPDTLPILKDRAHSDAANAVRRTAVQELARGWKDDPDTLPWLKDRARSDAANDVRMTAVRELARGWKDDPDTLPILKDRARSDAANDVRRTAVQELARGWKDDPDTLPILKDRARSDAANDVRMTAVRELARGWKDDPDTLPMLKERARSDDDANVRRMAVEELARGWKDDPDTLPILKDRARSDDAYAVRRTAVEELARGWKDDPDTLLILKDRARSDDAYEIRRTAVEELARGWKDDPDTLPILKDRARSDDVYAVRMTAVQELARGWKDDPDTLPILKDRARSDDDNDVRRTAVQELARGWKDDPAVQALLARLKNKSAADPDEPAASEEGS